MKTWGKKESKRKRTSREMLEILPDLNKQAKQKQQK